MWPAAEFGDAWADVYDAVFADLDTDAEHAVAALSTDLADGAGVLELGVGTGRLAIPLAATGLHVTGVDSSARMLAGLAAKAGGDAVRGVLGDMVDPPVEGPFDLVLIAFNTLFALPDQDRQVACVGAAARGLADGGRLVVEAAVPQPWRFADGDHDPVTQTVRSVRVVPDDTGVRTLPLNMRYAWPSEVDLMARLAGLSRVRRSGGWAGEPFDDLSTRHVTTYRKDPTT
ncbi:class I SAM-dependent DNA methyltransferase [Euzebya rosea]|uniref:class I SAM-dependent DNA methyltransferase n=1 Tax=Euzebya rosea TaxID=2052804 RepID=UPI000D3E14ED|nr:class I SAM-dependent methyltransferase [Euzebya rosea]